MFFCLLIVAQYPVLDLRVIKAKFLSSAVSNCQDCSKRLNLHLTP